MTSPNPLATAFVLIRPTSTGFGPALKRELDGASGAAAAAGTKAGKSWTDGFQKSGVTKAASRITEGIVAMGAASVYAAVKFQSAMEKVHTQAGVSQKAIKGLGDGILKLAGQVGFSPDSLSESLYHVESAFSSLGISGPKALRLVKVAAEGAAVGGASLVDVTNALTAFEASGIKGAQNMTHAMGIMNAIVGVGDMKMQDLADAFGTGLLASIKGFGVTIQDAGAALATFGDNNIRGAKAGQQLRMAVQALAQPTAAGAKELKALGINSGSLAQAMQQGGLKLALETLAAKLKAAGVSTKETGQILTETFGKRAGVGIQILLGQMDRFESKFPALNKGASTFGDAWRKTQATASQQLRELGASFEAMGVKIGQKLLPPLLSVMNFVRTHTTLVLALAAAIGTVAVAITAVSVAIKAWKAATEIATGLKAVFTNMPALIGLSVAALGFLAYKLVTAKSDAQGLTDALARQYHATGLNVAGYQKLAAALDAADRSNATLIRSLDIGRQQIALNAGGTDKFSEAGQRAAQTASNLRDSFRILGAQYGLTAGQAVKLITGSRTVNDLLAANGKLTPQVTAKIGAWAQSENKATGLTNLMSLAVDRLNSALDRQAGKVLTLQGDELAWRSALQQANAQLATNTGSLKGNSANAIANKQAVLNATETVVGFAKQQLISKGNLGGASSAIQDQIKWLRSLKDHSGFTAAEIKILVGWLRQIKSEQATIKIFGSGSYNIVRGGTRQPGTHPVAARGLYVSSGMPGVDDQPIMAQRGELVVPRHMVSAGAVDHLRGRIPGFAAGGVVGSYRDGVPGLSRWLRTENTATLTAIENAVALAALKVMRAGPPGGFGGVGGPGGGTAAMNARLARLMMPSWSSGAAWAAWNYVAMRESGWNQFADNPTSGAYGIPQALPYTKMPRAAWPPWAGGSANPAAQIGWMISYILGRYGSPQNAAAHEMAFNWYGSGLNAVFRRPTLIGVGERGPEHVMVTPAGRRGGNTYNITVNVPPTVNKAEVGRATVEAIIQFEKRSGKGWRS